MNTPLVSAVIPTRNRSDRLRAALQSVLDQTFTDIEIIVVDDASTDDTEKTLQSLSQKAGLRYLRNKARQGASRSRNIAIQEARGEFITGLDDDDTWHPQRVEKLLDAFQEGISAVCSFDLMVYNTRELIWKKKPQITHQDLLYYNQVGNQVLTKRDYLLNVGGFDETLPSAQDYDLWIRMTEEYGPVVTVPEPLQRVNMKSEEGRISTSEKTIEGYRACFEKHKAKMSKSQKKYQEYRLKLAAGDNPSLFEMVRAVPPSLLKKEVIRKYFL